MRSWPCPLGIRARRRSVHHFDEPVSLRLFVHPSTGPSNTVSERSSAHRGRDDYHGVGRIPALLMTSAPESWRNHRVLEVQRRGIRPPESRENKENDP